jgi:hypothetical protein
MSAPRWEFYCTLEAAPDLRWGWRVRSEGVLQEHSARRFISFVECHRDALQHGFAGSLEFGPSDLNDAALPASICGSRTRQGGPGSGAAEG